MDDRVELERLSLSSSTRYRLYGVVGSAQVSSKKIDSAPEWMLDKAVGEEIENAWKDAYVQIPEKDVPRSANVNGSQVVYTVKIEE